jgi:uncharacterized protein (DUF427 family)
MSLTFGPGPFSHQRAGLLSAGELPSTAAYAEPYPRRVRAFLRGQAVLDSERGWMLHAPGRLPELWFPADDLDAAALPGAALQDFRVGRDPVAAALAGFRSLDPDAADHWFVEDEPVYAHLRDPYHRVDVLSSHRHVVVEHAGTLIADTTRPKMLFETGLPPRYYLPWVDVRLELLERSDTVSECPYKGDGQHWHLNLGGQHLADAAWSLPHPLLEGIPAAGHVSFYQDKVAVTVDGDRLE